MHKLESRLDLSRCPGCSANSTGDFCSICGEQAPRRLHARQAAADLYEQLGSLDFPLLRTLFELALRPGPTLLGYFVGRRRGLASPARFFFFWATLAVAATLALGIPISAPSSSAALGTEANRALQQMPAFVFGLRVYLGFVLMLPIALLVKRLWRPSGIGFAEAYAVLLYAAALATLLRFLLATALHGLGGGELHAGWNLVLQGILQLYLLRAALGGHLIGDCARVLLLQLAYALLAPLVILPLFLAAKALGWL